jgi:hypothetical protein
MILFVTFILGAESMQIFFVVPAGIQKMALMILFKIRLLKLELQNEN